MPPRTESESLSLYYAHGYNLMNPVCRIICGNPTLRSYFELKQAKADDAAIRVRQILVDGGLYGNTKATDLLGVDRDDVNAAFTGDASIQTNAFIAQFKKDAPTQPLPAWQVVHDHLLAGIYTELYGRLLDTWKDLENVKSALHKLPQPDLGSGGKPTYIIRGDSQGMIDYLDREVPDFKAAVANNTALPMATAWTTNQPFSTSSGDDLAALAGRSMIWLIRVDPQTTEGRKGGAYLSEDEVLLPQDVRLALKGMIVVGSSADISHVDLSGIPHPDEVRARMETIYNTEGNSLKDKQVHFLLSEEEASA